MEDNPKNIEDQETREPIKDTKDNFVDTWLRFTRSAENKEKQKNQKAESKKSEEAVQPSSNYGEPERIGEIADRSHIPAVEAATAAELKRSAKTISNEQAELELQRAEFERQLDQKLTSKNTGISNSSLESSPPVNIIPENDSSTRPEVVMEQVEVAAAQDLPIEGLYERRHESKDQSANYSPLSGLDLVSSPSSKNAESSHITLNQNEASHGDETEISSVENKKNNKVDAGLYKQAIVGGFWTALLLVVVIMILILLS